MNVSGDGFGICIPASTDDFWNRYRRGRVTKSVWKSLKILMSARRKEKRVITQEEKDMAIEQFYSSLHELYKKQNLEALLNEDYNFVFTCSSDSSLDSETNSSCYHDPSAL